MRLNTVGFGVVRTPMTETLRTEQFSDAYLAQILLGRWTEVLQVARPVCVLLSDAASHITSQHFPANGGHTIGV
ncbi:MAG: SDR family oxidoreductase [Burkholderiaceae bacterium]|nr:SDR family oxidoreductase [Burkholderiaceae bacterium]